MDEISTPTCSRLSPRSATRSPINNKFCLGLVDFDVNNRGKSKQSALHGFELNLSGKREDLFCFSRGGQNKLNGETDRPREAPAVLPEALEPREWRPQGSIRIERNRLYVLHLNANPVNDSQGIGIRQGPDAHKHSGLS